MKITKKDIDSAKIKVTFIDPEKRRNQNLLATASVDFGDFFVRGYRVWRTKDAKTEFVNAPAFRGGGGGWVESFVIKNKKLWYHLQKLILLAFKKAEIDWSLKNVKET